MTREPLGRHRYIYRKIDTIQGAAVVGVLHAAAHVCPVHTAMTSETLTLDGGFCVRFFPPSDRVRKKGKKKICFFINLKREAEQFEIFIVRIFFFLPSGSLIPI